VKPSHRILTEPRLGTERRPTLSEATPVYELGLALRACQDVFHSVKTILNNTPRYSAADNAFRDTMRKSFFSDAALGSSALATYYSLSFRKHRPRENTNSFISAVTCRLQRDPGARFERQLYPGAQRAMQAGIYMQFMSNLLDTIVDSKYASRENLNLYTFYSALSDCFSEENIEHKPYVQNDKVMNQLISSVVNQTRAELQESRIFDTNGEEKRKFLIARMHRYERTQQDTVSYTTNKDLNRRMKGTVLIRFGNNPEKMNTYFSRVFISFKKISEQLKIHMLHAQDVSTIDFMAHIMAMAAPNWTPERAERIDELLAVPKTIHIFAHATNQMGREKISKLDERDIRYGETSAEQTAGEYLTHMKEQLIKLSQLNNWRLRDLETTWLEQGTPEAALASGTKWLTGLILNRYCLKMPRTVREEILKATELRHPLFSGLNLLLIREKTECKKAIEQLFGEETFASIFHNALRKRVLQQTALSA